MNSSSNLSLFPSNALTFGRIRDYVDLTKPRLVFLVLLSALVGFILGSREGVHFASLIPMIIGTLLVASGSMALNEWMERKEDARMVRTAKRPLPSSRLEPVQALVFGVFISVTGLLILEMTIGSRCSVLAALTLASYLFLYTPLKKKTSLCTIVGAIPGALPPLIGWSAAGEMFSFQGWILFSILFLWQMPHFLAIGWMYRDQYKAAGFRMLSCEDEDGGRVGRQILLYTLALFAVSLLPTVAGMTGYLYFAAAFALGLGLIACTVSSLKRMDQKSRQLFFTSILYLTCLLILMVLDKR
ncbi:MAG TPA: heme o synthase [bacterium]|nr:heme o synthase [bacterium]